MSDQQVTENRSNAKKLILLLVCLVLVIVVALMVWKPWADDKPSKAESSKSKVTPGGAKLERYPVPKLSTLKNDPAKAAQARVNTCEPLKPGGQKSMGVIKNDSKTDRDYTVTIFFMHEEDPINFAQTRVSVPAGKTYPWVVEKAFGTDFKLTCKLAAVS